jgi:hypothetical protein
MATKVRLRKRCKHDSVDAIMQRYKGRATIHEFLKESETVLMGIHHIIDYAWPWGVHAV